MYRWFGKCDRTSDDCTMWRHFFFKLQYCLIIPKWLSCCICYLHLCRSFKRYTFMDVDFMVYTDDWRFIDYQGSRTRCLVPFLGCSPSYSTFKRCFDTSLFYERSQILSELKFKLHSFPARTFEISSFSSNRLGFGGWTRNTGKFRLDTENRNIQLVTGNYW